MRFPALQHPLVALSIGVLVLTGVMYVHVRSVVPFRAVTVAPIDGTTTSMTIGAPPDSAICKADGSSDGMACTPSGCAGGGTIGTCVGAICTCSSLGLGVCGDGTKNIPVEQCDDGNVASNDGCSSDCKNEMQRYCCAAPGVAAKCASQVWVTSEQQFAWNCDIEKDTCLSSCDGTGVCGDGITQFLNEDSEIEECDNGTLNGLDDSSCTNKCKKTCPAATTEDIQICNESGRVWSYTKYVCIPPTSATACAFEPDCNCYDCPAGSAMTLSWDGLHVCKPNFDCPVPAGAQQSGITQVCAAKCNDIFDGPRVVQSCIAYCTCSCRNGQGDVAYTTAIDCIDKNPEANPACPSGSPACCRTKTVTSVCSAPPDGGGGGGGIPPPPPGCFPAPTCPPGNACVTYFVNLACACQQIRILPDEFCSGPVDDNGDGDSDDGIGGNDDNGDEENDDGIEDNSDDDGDGDEDDGIPGNDDGGDESGEEGGDEDGGDEDGDNDGDIGDIVTFSSASAVSSGGNDDDDGDGDNDDGDEGNEEDDGDGDNDDGIPGDEDDGDGDNDDGEPGNDDDDGDGDNDDGIPDDDEGDGGSSSVSSGLSIASGFSSAGLSGGSRASGVSTSRFLASGFSSASAVFSNTSALSLVLSTGFTSSAGSAITAPPRHAVCSGEACVLASGAGADECVIGLGCGKRTHAVCTVVRTCAQAPGPGANVCSAQILCGQHTECVNNACVVVAGVGQSECVMLADCVGRRPREKASGTVVRTLEQAETVAASLCGNGVTEFGEACDDGNTLGGDGCSAGCATEPGVRVLCGNRVLETGEECDDGNVLPGDGCGASCRLEFRENLVAAASLCGNGLLESREECDDSNRRDDDGCSSTCLLELGVCGDGIVQTLLGEQCEQATHDATLPYQCQRCLFHSLSCGDGKLDPGEECDDGPRNSTSPDADCRPDCHAFRCGDGILDSNEICDDGNRAARDGCDRYCRTEDRTQVAGETQSLMAQFPFDPGRSPWPSKPWRSGLSVGWQQYPFYQQMPMQFPYAQLQPLIAAQPATAQTGPAAIAVIGAGAAAGFSFIRNRRRRQ